MKRVLVYGGAAMGLVLVAAGAAAALVLPGRRSDLVLLAIPLVLLSLLLVLWKIRGQLDAGTDDPVPWATDDRFATPPPERTTEVHELSSQYFSGVVRDAGDAARSAGNVEAGVDVVRPALREALLDAMAYDDRPSSAAQDLLATGEWTDDRLAASVLDERVAPPDAPLGQRFVAWLFPEREVARRARRAVQAVAAAADESLPTVPGQRAPRTAKVTRPGLGELTRGADGSLQRAADREVAARGRDPAAPGPTAPDPGEPDADTEPGPEDPEADVAPGPGTPDADAATAGTDPAERSDPDAEVDGR